VEIKASKEIGLVVASEQLLGRSDRAAIILRVAVAYPTGIRLATSAVTRIESDANWNDDIADNGPDGIALGAWWTDTTDVTGVPSNAGFRTPLIVPDQEAEITRVPIQAGGGGNRYEITLWLTPLRPAGGRLRLAVAWPRLEIVNTHHDIEVPSREDLQDRATALWP
jgi:hypothetical protein